MKKIAYKKKIVLTALMAAIVSCGGGGGGGGGISSAPTPTAPTTTTPLLPSTPTTPPATTPAKPAPIVDSKWDSNMNYKWNDTTRVYNKDNPHQKSSVYTSGSTIINGTGVSVGVLDAGFNTTNPDLLTKMNTFFGAPGVRYEKTTAHPTTADEDHGIYVAEVVGGTVNGVARNVKLYLADVSKINGSEANPDPTVADYRGLYDAPRNVRIFNQSFGITQQVTEFNSSNYRASIGNDLVDFYNLAVNNGSLFVWAAGNEEKNSNPGLEAGLPYFEPSLEKGWINVVGLTAQKSHLTSAREFEWKNMEALSKAGLAKNWSVTVLGDHKYPKGGGYSVLTGSSYAAPVVTGTAALLKQKYPWMDGSLLRQTILSTATDIGKIGVDEDFGWGLINIDKAMNGPALFDKRLALGNDVVVNVHNPNNPLDATATYTFSNDISGDAGLVKNGAGTLVLSGNSITYTGTSLVNAGKLVIKGKTYNPSGTRITLGSFVVSGDTKIGNGVSNEAGTFEIDGSNVTVGGNYTAEKAARTVLNSNSKLHVEGKASLNDSILVLKSEKDGETQYVTAKGTEASITSDNGIEGKFGSVETSELLNGNVFSDENGVKAELSRKNVEEYVTGLDMADDMKKDVAENIEASFKALDTEIEKGNGEAVQKFALSAAKIQSQALSLPTSQSVLDSLSGQIYGSAQALTFQHSQTVNKDLSNRLVMLGTLENVGTNAGVWVTGIGASGKLKQDGFGTGKTKVAGGQVGIDRQFTDSLILGTALSYSKSDVKFDRYGGESKADQFGISLYGRLGNKEVPYYLQGRIGIGFVDSKVERDIMLSGTDTSRAKINHRDRALSGYLEAGYDVRSGSFTLTPFAGLSHDSVRRGAFSEENSQFGLTAGKKTYNQTSGLVGLRAGYGVDWGNGSRSTFQGYVTHQRAFREQDLSFEASYTGLSNAKFKVKGIGLSRNSTWVGAGVLTEVSPNFSWYVNYDGKIDSKGRNNVYTTGFRFNF